jgi:hypothetical protein
MSYRNFTVSTNKLFGIAPKKKKQNTQNQAPKSEQKQQEEVAQNSEPTNNKAMDIFGNLPNIDD